MHETVLMILFWPHHQRLNDRGYGFFMTSSTEDKAQRKSRKCNNLQRGSIVVYDFSEKLRNLFLLRTRIRQTKSHDGTNSNSGILLRHTLVQQTVSRITVVAYVCVDQSDSE